MICAWAVAAGCKGESREAGQIQSMQNQSETDKLASTFKQLRTVKELAALLEVDYGKHLVYYLYRIPIVSRYFEFEIRKRRSDGQRRIAAPATNLKRIQQRLNNILQLVYQPKRSVHGFVLRRNIITNAEGHVRSKYILNLDIQDFFPSINFGRVRGLFLARPYEFPPPVATVLAQICCHNNELPQGAPTSPVISNMICSRLDKQLQDLAADRGCYYTRYADDMTFSISRNRFPTDLAFVETAAERAGVKIGTKLQEVILANGFKINHEKTRLEVRGRRLNVTGSQPVC